jgi:acyl-CoA hydrolase
VQVGELVSLMASVNYVGKSSLVIGIKVVSENVKTHLMKHTNTSYFTMVALDDVNQPLQVPGLVLENELEIRRFWQARQRRELKKNYKANEAQMKAALGHEDYLKQLKGERCYISVRD